MKKLISTMIMLAILIFALSTSVQAYTMSYTGKTEVESGETFDVIITVDEQTALANGHLSYDSSLFTFVRANQSNMSAQNYPGEGRVNWMYTDLGNDDPAITTGTGTKTFTFTFKAADVTEEKKGTFSLSDFVVTTTDDKEYEQSANTISGSKSVDVTIKKKSEQPSNNITLNPSMDFSIEKGETKQITASGANGTVTWSSSNTSVATVDSTGKVTAVGKGTATITATDSNGNTKSIKVTVTEKTTDNGNNTIDNENNTSDKGNNTAVKNNNAVAGKKDNTQTPDSKLPQTGESFARFAVLAIAFALLTAGLVFKSKFKNLNKLFVIIPLVAAISISGAVNALKVVDDDTMKAGIFEKGDLLDDIAVVAVSPSKSFSTSDKLTVDIANSILANMGGYDVINDANGDKIEDPEYLATGYELVMLPDGGTAGKTYKVLLYGDANGDGNICNAIDVNVIRQDYVFNKKAEGVYKKAADLYADDVLNVRDIQRMTKKYLGTLDGTLVTPFPGEREITLNPSEDFELAVNEEKTITADTEVTWSWDNNSNVADVIPQEDGSVKVIGKNPGTIDITATDANGNQKTITVTVTGQDEPVAPEIEVTTSVEGDKVTVNVNVTNGVEIEDYSYIIKKIPTGPDQQAETIANSGNIEDSEWSYEGLANGSYNCEVSAMSKDGVQSNHISTNFVINKDRIKPTIEFAYRVVEQDVTLSITVTNLEEIQETTDIDMYNFEIYNKLENGERGTKVGGGETPSSTEKFDDLEPGSYIAVGSVKTLEGTQSDELELPFDVKGNVTISFAIKDYDESSVTVEAGLEGAEIDNVKYLWQYEPEAVKDTNEFREAGKVTEAPYEFTYNHSNMNYDTTLNIPFEFKAVITTTDGRVFETNNLQWRIGYLGEAPEIDFTSTVNGNNVTFDVELLNDVTPVSYQYKIVKLPTNASESSTIIVDERSDEPTYTYEGLADGTYIAIVAAYSDKGASSMVHKNFGIRNSDAVLERTDFTRDSVTVEASITGKEIASVEYFWKYPDGYTQDTNEPRSVGTTTETTYTFNQADIGTGSENPYQFLAKITTTDNEEYTTNEIGWRFGYLGIEPALNTTVDVFADTVTASVEVTNLEDVEAFSPIDHCRYALTGILGTEGSYNSNDTTDTTYSFTNIPDGQYNLSILAVTEKGANSIVNQQITIRALDEGETKDESEAVAYVDSTGKMYTSVQAAINAVKKSFDSVNLLTDVTESVTIPADKKIYFGLNGYTLTGSAENDYTIKVLGELHVVSGAYAALTGEYIEKENGYIIREPNSDFQVLANIMVGETTNLEDGTNAGDGAYLEISKNTSLINKSSGTSNIRINSSNVTTYIRNSDIYDNGSTASTNGIYDLGENNRLVIYDSYINGYTAVNKSGSGTLRIGAQPANITKNFTLDESNIVGHTTLNVSEDVTVYFFGGKLECTDQTQGVTPIVCNHPFVIRNDVNSYTRLIGNYDTAEAYYEVIED